MRSMIYLPAVSEPMAAASNSSGSPIVTIGIVLGLIGAVVIFVLSNRAAKAQREADAAAGVLATLSIPGAPLLRLTSDALLEGREDEKRHALAGLVGRVEEGGSVNRRFTVTRIAVLGVLAAGVPKRVDDRELYLTIEGPDTVIVHAIQVKNNKTLPGDARRFVARLNQLSGANSTPARVQEAAPAAPSPSAPDQLAAKLEELSKLLAAGVITDGEYQAKRADLISRF